MTPGVGTQTTRTGSRPSRHLSVGGIVLLYVAVGVAWILLSDVIVEQVLPGEEGEVVDSVKGVGFVIVTALALFGLLVARELVIDRGRRELEASEERFRLLAERSQDVIYRYRLRPDPGFEFVSRSVTALTGYTPEEHLADPQLGAKLIHPEDLPLLAEVQAGRWPPDRPIELRWVRKDGSILWTEHRIVLVHDDSGGLWLEGSARDIGARKAAEADLRLLHRAVQDTGTAVLIVKAAETTADRIVVFANGSAVSVVGRPVTDIVGEPLGSLAGELQDPVALDAIREALRDHRPWNGEIDLLRPDGRSVTVGMDLAPVLTPSGRADHFVILMDDVTELRARQRAVIEAEARLRAMLDSSPLAVVSVDRDATITSWSPAAERVLGIAAADVIGRPYAVLGTDDAAWLAQGLREVMAGEVLVGVPVRLRHRDGHLVDLRFFAAPIRDAAGAVAGAVVVAEDSSALQASEAERSRLLVAIDQAAEAIVLTDAQARIQYVNPAFEAVTGYGRDEVIGQNPRILKSGLQDAAFYASMWATLARGDRWRGVLVNRAKTGELFEEDATVSPVKGPDGAIVGYVGVKRDLTRERALEADLEREMADRAVVSSAIDRIRPGADAEATAAIVCDEVVHLDGITFATVLHVPRVGAGVVELASAVALGLPRRTGELFVAGFGDRLRTWVSGGAWAQVFEDEAINDADFAMAMRSAGLTAAAFAPIRHDDRVAGVLICATDAEDAAAWIDHRLAAVIEVATHAGALLGPQLATRDDVSAARGRIARIAADGAFHPVFQPVVALDDGAAHGFEALTRFDDGVRPDLRFAEAAAVGLTIDLEAACLRAAIEAAAALPDDVWLSLNVSPDMVASGALNTILEAPARPIVLELTEHVAIDDYDALRQALGDLGPAVRVAVDDAGAGFASLRHVLELRPDLIKLDLGLVRGIEGDPARQSLVAGMVHYAGETGTELIAEGIETDAEAETLRRLGVRLGQGYLFARPAPLSQRANA